MPLASEVTPIRQTPKPRHGCGGVYLVFSIGLEFDNGMKLSPQKFTDLNIAFEADAVCCNCDLAFLVG